jgi:hypothetical protein
MHEILQTQQNVDVVVLLDLDQNDESEQVSVDSLGSLSG